MVDFEVERCTLLLELREGGHQGSNTRYTASLPSLLMSSMSGGNTEVAPRVFTSPFRPDIADIISDSCELRVQISDIFALSELICSPCSSTI